MISATVVVVVLLSARAAVNRRAVFPAARLDANVVRVALRHRHTHTHTVSLTSTSSFTRANPRIPPIPHTETRSRASPSINRSIHRDVLAPIRTRRHDCVSHPPPRVARTTHVREDITLARISLESWSCAKVTRARPPSRFDPIVASAGTTARGTPHVRLGISSRPLTVFHTNRASVNTSSINHPRRRSDRSTRERNISA